MKFLQDITFEAYLTSPALSRSGLVDFRIGPHLYKYPKKEKASQSMKMGTALHAMLLEPDIFKANYTYAPEGMSFATKAGKEWKAANEGKIILKVDEWTALNEMTLNTKTHKIAGPLLEAGQFKERTIFFEIEGHPMKCRPDLIYIPDSGPPIIVDFKTNKSLDSARLKPDIKNRGYDMQLALIEMAMAQHSDFKEFQSTIVFIENKPPYDVRVVNMLPENINKAKLEVIELVKDFKECLKNDRWPSKYADTVETLDLTFFESRTPIEEEPMTYGNEL